MKHIINFFKGIALGIAMLIPGVSGGTLAIILGIYDKLIHSVSTIFKKFKENIVFLGILGLGLAVSLLTLSNVISFGLKNARFAMIFLFLGFIIGSLPALFKEADLKQVKPVSYIWLLFGLAVVIGLSFLREGTAAENIDFFGMFVAGFIACVALIIPGISGSYLLLTLGLYEKVIDLIKFDGDFSKIGANILQLLPFGLGIIVGVILTVKGIEYLLKNHRNESYLAIIGFVGGSAVTLFMENIPYGLHILYSLIAFAIGAAIAYTLNRWGNKPESNDIKDI